MGYTDLYRTWDLTVLLHKSLCTTPTLITPPAVTRDGGSRGSACGYGRWRFAVTEELDVFEALSRLAGLGADVSRASKNGYTAVFVASANL